MTFDPVKAANNNVIPLQRQKSDREKLIVARRLKLAGINVIDGIYCPVCSTPSPERTGIVPDGSAIIVLCRALDCNQSWRVSG